MTMPFEGQNIDLLIQITDYAEYDFSATFVVLIRVRVLYSECTVRRQHTLYDTDSSLIVYAYESAQK